MSDSETDTDAEEQKQQEPSTEKSSTGSNRNDDDDSTSPQKKFVYGLSIVALLGGIGAAIYFFVIKNKEQIDENNGSDTQQNTSFLVPGIVIALVLLGAGGFAYYFVRRRKKRKNSESGGTASPPKKTTKRALARKQKQEEAANEKAKEVVKDLKNVGPSGEEITGDKKSLLETLMDIKKDRKHAKSKKRRATATTQGFNKMFADTKSRNGEVTNVSSRFDMNVGDFHRLCAASLTELNTVDLTSSLAFVSDAWRTTSYLGTDSIVNKNILKQKSKEKQNEVILDVTKTPNYQFAMFKYRAFLIRVAASQIESVLNDEPNGAYALLEKLKELQKIQPVTESVRDEISNVAAGIVVYIDVARKRLRQLHSIEKESYGENRILGPNKEEVIVSVVEESNESKTKENNFDPNMQNKLFLRDYKTYRFKNIEEAEAAAAKDDKLQLALSEWEDAKEEYEDEVEKYKQILKEMTETVDTDFRKLDIEVQLGNMGEKILRRLSGLTEFAENDIRRSLGNSGFLEIEEKKKTLLNDLKEALNNDEIENDKQTEDQVELLENI